MPSLSMKVRQKGGAASQSGPDMLKSFKRYELVTSLFTDHRCQTMTCIMFQWTCPEGPVSISHGCHGDQLHFRECMRTGIQVSCWKLEDIIEVLINDSSQNSSTQHGKMAQRTCTQYPYTAIRLHTVTLQLFKPQAVYSSTAQPHSLLKFNFVDRFRGLHFF